MMEHLTEEQLNEYLDNSLEAAELARMGAHLSECTDCRARLAALQTVFQALAALPEETPGHELTSSVLKALPNGLSGLGWRLAFAMQTGLSLGFLLLFFPFMTVRIAGILPGLTAQLAVPEVKFPNPTDFHFSPPVLPFSNPSHPFSLALPVAVTHANFSIWLLLGIAAVLLFIVGNFSLIFHNTSGARK
jgi:anti-sigma factor RsiW